MLNGVHTKTFLIIIIALFLREVNLSVKMNDAFPLFFICARRPIDDKCDEVIFSFYLFNVNRLVREATRFHHSISKGVVGSINICD